MLNNYLMLEKVIKYNTLFSSGALVDQLLKLMTYTKM